MSNLRELKLYKIDNLLQATEKNSVYYLKTPSNTKFKVYVSDIDGNLISQEDLTGGGGGSIVNVISTDGTITVLGTTIKDISVSAGLVTLINAALQPGDNISQLFNDAGYITLADLPTKTSDLINDGDDTVNPFIDRTDNFTQTLDGTVPAPGTITGKVLSDDGTWITITPGTTYTDEEAQDAVGTILVDSSTIDFDYNDGTPSITADVKPNSIDATHLSDTINVSEFINDGDGINPYLTDKPVVDGYLSGGIFYYDAGLTLPISPATETIYVNLTTGFAYSWNGSAYVQTFDSGIRGSGLVNRIAKFVGSTTIGNAAMDEILGITRIGTLNRTPYAGSMLSLQRNQSQLDFVLGNPDITPTPTLTEIVSDNNIGLRVRSRGYLSLITATVVGVVTTYFEGIRINNVGNTILPIVPLTDAGSEPVLVRDATTGEVKQRVISSVAAPDADTTTKGILKLTNDLGGTAALPTTPTALHITGNETKTGNLTLNGVLNLPPLTALTGETNNIGIDDLGNIVVSPLDNAFVISAKNTTGVTITKGSSVYINGANGSKATIALALGDSNVTTSLAVGLVKDDILNNGIGYVVVVGEIKKLNTVAFTNGAKVFLSSTTPGALTATPPVSPNNVVLIGTVLNSHATQGIILIGIQYTSKLDRLTDVAIATPLNDEALTYETSSGLWKNKSIAARVLATVITGFSAAAGTVVNTDTILQVINKLVGNIALKADTASPTLTGTVTTPAIIVSSETASTIASFDASKNIKSLSTSTYPSLTELAYLKGVTSAIQPQLNRVIYKRTTDTAALTGSTLVTQIDTITIPANTFVVGDILDIFWTFNKTGVVGTFTQRMLISNSATFGAAVTIAVGTPLGATILSSSMQRHISFRTGNNIEAFSSGFAAQFENVSSTSARTVTGSIDPTQTIYLYLAGNLGNAADSVLITQVVALKH